MFCKEFSLDIKNTDAYSADTGYGLIDLLTIQNASETDSDAALKCGGWNLRRLSEPIIDRNVAVFRIDVPEFGTYRIDASINARDSDSNNLTLFAGRRNMVANRFSVKKGKSFEISFYQAVTPYIPALRSERCNDKCIFLSVSGSDDLVMNISVIKEDVPVIWVAGDSTLTDQNAGIPYYPYGSCSGWAQTLSRFIKNAAVCNLAHSGMTSNCFRDDGHYDIIKEMIKPGDFFIMQFGHNDQKRRNLSAFGGYKENLKEYAIEIKSFGATPIICSPISRIPLEIAAKNTSSTNTFSEDIGQLNNHSFYSLLLSYAKACAEAAKETETLFIDLHRLTFDKWVSDIDAAKDFFMPGDITHTNEYGSLLISGVFVDEIRSRTQGNADNCVLQAKKVIQDTNSSENNAVSMFENFDNQNEVREYLPSENTKLLPKEFPGPDIFSIEPPYVDIKGIAEYEGIKKAYRYGLLDPCVMYLHPYATMPRAQLLMVMFKAFRIPGVRPYTGPFKDIFYDEWDSGYVQALVNENLIDTDTDLFRPDDALAFEEFAGFLIKFMEPDRSKRAALSFDECLKKACALGILNSATLTEDSKISTANKKATSNTGKLPEKYELAAGDKISRAEVYSALAKFIDIIGAAKEALPSDTEVHPVH